jgi:hypothetical protein
VHIRSFTRPVVLGAVVAVVGALGTTLPAASASPVRAAARPRPDVARGAQPFAALHRPALPAGERYVCPAPTRPGQMTCMSIIASRPHHESGWAVPASASNSYGPSDLRSAYKIATQSARNGSGRLVAIVDAFKDPDAVSNLATYRQHFHLGACTTSSGCLKIVNQSGNTSPLPKADPLWATEESLDLDMVSAICPRCHILLVEARSESTGDLGTAEKTAVSKGAKYVSNSWSGGEFFGQDQFNSDFNHPGDVIDFAAGDFGYAPAYPTDLQYVTAVGGTSLRRAGNKRGWSETVWGTANSLTSPDGGTGGGCSGLEPKPSWQRADATAPGGCLLRTENDVSAVGDPNTGVLIYDTYKSQPSGLFEIGGTSVSTPIITAIYALAGTPTSGSYPAEYPYLHSSRLFDVTSGTNGRCESFRQYLCHGERGYDGPTGLGTPNGTGAFTDSSAHRVALVDPGTQDVPVSGNLFLTVTGLDTRRVSSLRWSATGLPAGLSIHAISNSTKGRITGKLPGAVHTYHVVVTARDGSVSGTTHFNIVIAPNMAGPNPPSGPITLFSDTSLCLDDGTGAVSQPVKIQSCGHPTSQDWAYVADGAPDDNGTLRIAGKCLSIGTGTRLVLGSCDGALKELWGYFGGGVLFNLETGGCLTDPNQSAGTQAEAANCTFLDSQIWNLPGGPLIEGAGALCLDNPSSTQVKVSTCHYHSVHRQLWSLEGDFTIADSTGQCLAVKGQFSATAVTVEPCDDTNLAQQWGPGPGGQLINFGSGKCLADSGNGGPGTVVVQNDCYGDVGELWGLN